MRSKFFAPFLFAVAFLGGSFWWYKYALSSPVSKGGGVVEFTVSPGESPQRVAVRLKDQGIIRDPLTFRLFLQWRGLDTQIQAGKFQLSSSMSAQEVAQALIKGAFDVVITIPEGLRVEEIGEKIISELVKEQDSPHWLTWKEEFIKQARLYEGFLFPDTYFIPLNASPSAVLSMMRSNFDRRVDDKIRKAAESQGLNLERLINLASIVEREAKFAEDRPLVAGILLRRYQEGSLLGADATVQYVLGFSSEENVWWREKLTAEDLEVESPYNTRKFSGFPPTPICNPGLEAIRAASYPQDTHYYYYLSDQDGKMHYAITLSEHLANMERYLSLDKD
jgi:UPF0755 protein